jgi:hypothetical protein
LGASFFRHLKAISGRRLRCRSPVIVLHTIFVVEIFRPAFAATTL